MKKVVVTGMGIVSCLGQDIDQFWHALLNGQSGIKLIKKFDTTDFATKFAGEINDFDPVEARNFLFVISSSMSFLCELTSLGILLFVVVVSLIAASSA